MTWSRLLSAVLPSVCVIFLARPTQAQEFPLPICVVDLTYQCGLLSRQGQWLLEPQFKNLRASGNRWISTSHSGLIGLLDFSARQIKAPEFLGMSNFVNGYAAAQDLPTGNWGVIDEQGNWHLPPRYAYGRVVNQTLYLLDADGTHWLGLNRAGKVTRRLSKLPQDIPQESHLPPMKTAYQNWVVSRGFSDTSSHFSPPNDIFVVSNSQSQHYLDQHQNLLFVIHHKKLCETIDTLEDKQGQRLWPRHPEALCWLVAHRHEDHNTAPAALQPTVQQLLKADMAHKAQADRERMRISRAPPPFYERSACLQRIA